MLTGNRRPDPSEVVVTVAHRMILQHKLAGERSITIERHGRGAIQLFIAKSTYCRCRHRTVGCQKGERGFLSNAIILFRVVSVHRIDDVPGNAGDRLAGSEQTREVDLDWIHTGNVMHHYANLPSVLGKARLPLCFRKCGRKCSQCCCAGLETGGERLRSVAHFLLLSSSRVNSDSHEGGRYRSAAVSALVLGFRQFQKLVVEFLHFSALLRRFESVHRWAIESSKGFDEMCWAFVERDEEIRDLDHGYPFLGHAGLTKTLDDVSIHAPSHRANEAFRRRRHKR